MVFIDYQNFQCALTNYYKKQDLHSPRLDYNLLPELVCSKVKNAELVKTFLCAPKPNAFLMNDPTLKKQFDWLSALNNQRNFDVIEGEYVARPAIDGVQMDISKRETFYKEEKGTDINIAVESITKAFNNAYDISIFMSADTDYLPIYKTLRTIGKLVVVAIVKDQYIGKLVSCIDSFVTLDKADFDTILR